MRRRGAALELGEILFPPLKRVARRTFRACELPATQLDATDLAADARAAVLAMRAARRVSKFQPCLPREMEADPLVEALLGVAGARAAVG